ncbi:MAG: hypothetical protein MJ237_05510 [bacterium]|nr:hypothetical protein [bacterium]
MRINSTNSNSFKANVPSNMAAVSGKKCFIPKNIIECKFAQKKKNPRNKYDIELVRFPFGLSLGQTVKKNGRLLKSVVFDTKNGEDDFLITSKNFSSLTGKIETCFQYRKNENEIYSLKYNPLTEKPTEQKIYNKNMNLTEVNLVDEHTGQCYPYSKIIYLSDNETILEKYIENPFTNDPICKEEYSTDGTVNTITYYDKATGDIICAEQYYPDGSTVFMRLKPCPENNNTILTECFAEDGKTLVCRIVNDIETNKPIRSFEYNDKGILTRKLEFDQETGIDYITEEYYNDGITIQYKSVKDPKTQIVILIESYSPDGKSCIKSYFDNITGKQIKVEMLDNGCVRTFS